VRGEKAVSVKLEDLKPDVMFKAQRGVQKLIDGGISFSIRRTLSTTGEQYAYWLQGRAELGMVNAARVFAYMRPLLPAENTYTVTNCDGKTIKSKHQGGRAIDIVPKDENGNPTWNYMKYANQYRQIADVMKDMGFKCGVDWAPFDKATGLGWDPPHYEA
jgi:hypothetical protein